MMQIGSVNAVSRTRFFYHRLKTLFIPILIEKTFKFQSKVSVSKEMDLIKTGTKKQ
jgi:hypothetical protein